MRRRPSSCASWPAVQTARLRDVDGGGDSVTGKTPSRRGEQTPARGSSGGSRTARQATGDRAAAGQRRNDGPSRPTSAQRGRTADGGRRNGAEGGGGRPRSAGQG